MGLFDKLLNQGVKTLGNMVSDALMNDQGELGKTLREVKSSVDSLSGPGNGKEGSGTAAGYEDTADVYDRRIFEEKLMAVLECAGRYEVRRNISPDELEQEAGTQIYTRGSNYRRPDCFTYGIFHCDRRVLFINYWDDYNEYRHAANRQIRDYCDRNSIGVLDFFSYLPNKYEYMEERIRARLV